MIHRWLSRSTILLILGAALLFLPSSNAPAQELPTPDSIQWLRVWTSPQVPHGYRSPEGPHKVVVLERDSVGLSIIGQIESLAEFRYQDRRSYLIADDVLQMLSREQAQRLPLRDDLNLIRLRDRYFDTTLPQPPVPAGMAQVPRAGPQLFLVQFASTVRSDWVSDLAARAGLEIVHYIPENAYLVWADEASRTELLAEVTFVPHLQWAGPFHPAYKLHPAFDLQFQGPVQATIRMYGHPQVQASIESIRERAVRISGAPQRAGPFLHLSVEIAASELEAIARYEDVVGVEPFVEFGTAGERQAQVLAGNLSTPGSGTNSPGYLDWLASLGFQPNFEFVVDLTDDGFDRGEVGDGQVHPVFLDPAGNSRVSVIHA